ARGKHPPGSIPDGSNSIGIGKSTCTYFAVYKNCVSNNNLSVSCVTASQSLKKGLKTTQLSLLCGWPLIAFGVNFLGLFAFNKESKDKSDDRKNTCNNKCNIHAMH